MARHKFFEQLVDSCPADSDDMDGREAFDIFLDQFANIINDGSADVPDEEALLGSVKDRMLAAHGAQIVAQAKRQECSRAVENLDEGEDLDGAADAAAGLQLASQEEATACAELVRAVSTFQLSLKTRCAGISRKHAAQDMAQDGARQLPCLPAGASMRDGVDEEGRGRDASGDGSAARGPSPAPAAQSFLQLAKRARKQRQSTALPNDAARDGISDALQAGQPLAVHVLF